MKKLILVVAMLMLVCSGFAQTRVKGYTKKNGTYVAPHYKSKSDGKTSNNYSTKGNTNPYTGKKGTASPYKRRK